MVLSSVITRSVKGFRLTKRKNCLHSRNFGACCQLSPLQIDSSTTFLGCRTFTDGSTVVSGRKFFSGLAAGGINHPPTNQNLRTRNSLNDLKEALELGGKSSTLGHYCKNHALPTRPPDPTRHSPTRPTRPSGKKSADPDLFYFRKRPLPGLEMSGNCTIVKISLL